MASLSKYIPGSSNYFLGSTPQPPASISKYVPGSDNYFLNQQQGQVQGAQKIAPVYTQQNQEYFGGYSSPTPTPTPTPISGGDGGGNAGPSIQDMLNQQYEALLSPLNSRENELSVQKANQETQATNAYNQAQKTLDTQFSTNKGDIESGQKKALTDIADAIRQQWQQGNVMLGTRGASDSSAAKQYSYALTKMGTQQQGDIMQENARRMDSLRQTYELNSSEIETQKNNQLLQIANWFSEAKNSIAGLRADLQAQKYGDLISMAQQAVQDSKAQADQKLSVLDQWAANTAQSLPQLTNMLAQNAQNLPAFQGLYANMQGTGGFGGGMFGFNQGEDNKNLFGNA